MEQNIISVQKHVKYPLNWTLKNIMIWPGNFLININNIVVGGNASFLSRFRIGSLTMYMKQLTRLLSPFFTTSMPKLFWWYLAEMVTLFCYQLSVT